MSRKNLNVIKKIPNLLKYKLKNKKINLIYKEFNKNLSIKENFIVAVSGGPDSLTLAFLAKIYSIKNHLDCKFYIIDHKIRPESTKEAKKVKKILKQNFIEAEILTWKGKKPVKIKQSLAREKRYELLFAKCHKFKIKNILLGHHQDDLLENFFIRILRGSGLKGLISLDKKSKVYNINLLRPLIDCKKSDLEFASKHVFDFYVQDPSNKDEKYQRIRIRKLIREFEKDGLDKKKFIKTLDNLKHSNNVIKFYINKNLEKNSCYSDKKNRLILSKEFFEQSYEVIFRSFSESIHLIGNKHYPARGKKIEKIINDLKNNRIFKATLGGCIIEKVNQTVIISKEN